MLSIDPAKVLFVIEKMRELEEEDVIEAGLEESADNGDELHMDEPVTDETSLVEEEDDDTFIDESEESDEERSSADPYQEELATFISNMDDDEQIELTALAWVGRGDYDLDTWEDALEAARDRHNDRTASYLMGIPVLPDYLAEGLAAHGVSVEELK